MINNADDARKLYNKIYNNKIFKTMYNILRDLDIAIICNNSNEIIYKLSANDSDDCIQIEVGLRRLGFNVKCKLSNTKGNLIYNNISYPEGTYIIIGFDCIKN